MTTSVISKLKKPYIMLLTIILLIIIALISTFAYRKTIQRKYIDNVELILNIVETDANFSYERFQLICKVWNNTILEKHDSETNQYTLNDGNFLNPKAALYNLFNDENFVKKVNAAKSRMILVQDCMDELIELSVQSHLSDSQDWRNFSAFVYHPHPKRWWEISETTGCNQPMQG